MSKVRAAVHRARGVRVTASQPCAAPAAHSRDRLLHLAVADRAERREARELAKERSHDGDGASSERAWRDIPGMWAAYAVDGRGHRRVDGNNGLYDVLLPVALFEGSRGGMARLLKVPGGDSETFTIPNNFSATHLKVRLQVSGVAGGGRMILVTGLQVCM